jgi:hypothetical protein
MFGHHLDWHRWITSSRPRRCETVAYDGDQRISEAKSREQPLFRNVIRKRVADQGDVEDIQQEIFYWRRNGRSGCAANLLTSSGEETNFFVGVGGSVGYGVRCYRTQLRPSEFRGRNSGSEKRFVPQLPEGGM